MVGRSDCVDYRTVASQLAKTTGWTIHYKCGWLTNWYPISRNELIGRPPEKGRCRVITNDGWQAAFARSDISIRDACILARAFAGHEPAKPPNDPRLAIFADWVWRLSKAEALLDDDHLKLILMDKIEKDQRRLERLAHQQAAGTSGETKRREHIPEDVRAFVWRRDQGQCVQCGSRDRLEFDHIIPVAKGGSSTARNLQVLCENCNREKSDHI